MAVDISGITFNDGEPIDALKLNKLKQAIIDVDNAALKVAASVETTAAGVISSTISAGSFQLPEVVLTGSAATEVVVPMSPELSGPPASIVCTVTTGSAKPDFSYFIKKGSEKSNQFTLVLQRVRGVTDKTEASDTYASLKVNYIGIAKQPTI
jgi:hypothetical protein